MSEARGPWQGPTAVELQANGTTREHVVISVHGHVYQLDAPTFTQWQVREVAEAVAVSTGQPYDQVVDDVTAAYAAALDGASLECAA